MEEKRHNKELLDKAPYIKKHNEEKEDFMLYFLNYFPFDKWRVFLWNTILLTITIIFIILLIDVGILISKLLWVITSNLDSNIISHG